MITLLKDNKSKKQNRLRPRILIADDDSTNTMLLDKVLQMNEFDTVVARSGSDCVSMAFSTLPDLILLDVMMPGIDGIEVCKILNSNEATSNIPVIFISAMTGTKNKISGFESGAVDYITKPFNRDELIARVKVHLRKKQKNQDLMAEKDSRLQQVYNAQQQLLVDPDEIPDARFAVKYVSICEAGGDFYDVVKVSENQYAYLVSDFSGHDIGASFATPALKALFRENVDLIDKPEMLFAKINSGLKPLMSSEEYMTAAYLLVDRDAMQATIASAGHPPIIHLNSSGTLNLFSHNSDVLGPFYDINIQCEKIDISETDRFYLFTDGLFERFQSKDFSRNSSLKLLRKSCIWNNSMSLDTSLDLICQDLQSSLGSLEDDVVLLGVEI